MPPRLTNLLGSWGVCRFHAWEIWGDGIIGAPFILPFADDPRSLPTELSPELLACSDEESGGKPSPRNQPGTAQLDQVVQGLYLHGIFDVAQIPDQVKQCINNQRFMSMPLMRVLSNPTTPAATGATSAVSYCALNGSC